jgi:hypothetical protein
LPEARQMLADERLGRNQHKGVLNQAKCSCAYSSSVSSVVISGWPVR